MYSECLRQNAEEQRRVMNRLLELQRQNYQIQRDYEAKMEELAQRYNEIINNMSDS